MLRVKREISVTVWQAKNKTVPSHFLYSTQHTSSKPRIMGAFVVTMSICNITFLTPLNFSLVKPLQRLLLSLPFLLSCTQKLVILSQLSFILMSPATTHWETCVKCLNFLSFSLFIWKTRDICLSHTGVWNLIWKTSRAKHGVKQTSVNTCRSPPKFRLLRYTLWFICSLGGILKFKKLSADFSKESWRQEGAGKKYLKSWKARTYIQ